MNNQSEINVLDRVILEKLQMMKFSEEDLRVVRQFKPIVEENIEQLVELFYQTILQVNELKEKIEQHSTVERLRRTLKRHLIEMFQGNMDDEFVAKRLRVAKIHYSIGLTPSWYMAAFENLNQAFQHLIFEHIKDVNRVRQTLSSVQKMLSLEEQLVLGAYESENNRYREEQFTTQTEINEKLRKANREYENIFNSVDALFFSYDLKQNSLMVSKELSHFLNIKEGQGVSPSVWDSIIHPDDRQKFMDSHDRVFKEKVPVGGEYRIMFHDGEVRWVHHRAKPILDEHGEIYRINGVLIDETERIELEQQIQHHAFYDSLTDLPNRHYLMEKLQELFMTSKNAQHAILFVDFDNFKNINDYYGHHAGDQYLKMMAERLRQQVDREDNIFRLGGDEFILIQENTSVKEVEAFARKVLGAFEHAISWNGATSFITPSVGIALYPNHGNDVDTLITNADTAMYAAKECGKNRYQIFTNDISKKMTKKMLMENDMKKMLDQKELSLVYQPIMSLETGKMVSVEALSRWHHPTVGTISPLEFIPIAENSRAILPIGEWVLAESLKQLKEWHQSGYDDLKMSVNVSPIQLMDPLFVKKVTDILQKVGISPEFLILEITENVSKDSKELINVLEQLDEIGVKLSIDDFGKGYSSFYTLLNVSFDYLKIDRAFIKDINVHPNRTYLLKTIIEVGRNLNLTVIGEGVETQEQLDFLSQNNCTTIQGYHFSPPVPPKEIEKHLSVV